MLNLGIIDKNMKFKTKLLTKFMKKAIMIKIKEKAKSNTKFAENVGKIAKRKEKQGVCN